MLQKLGDHIKSCFERAEIGVLRRRPRQTHTLKSNCLTSLNNGAMSRRATSPYWPQGNFATSAL
jgi:hypothetical protein